eukprot:5401257-Alexandrium_andersonii.AAC.1
MEAALMQDSLDTFWEVWSDTLQRTFEQVHASSGHGACTARVPKGKVAVVHTRAADTWKRP